MSRLDLNRLKNNKEAILKAEIVSMITLWDKLEPYEVRNGDIKEKINYKYSMSLNIKNLDDWKNLLDGLSLDFKDTNNNTLKSFQVWNEFLNKWRDWRKQDYLLQILYGISESLNSGIDKGSPKENVKVEPKNERWLANAFGSNKRKIIYWEREEDEINNIIDDTKDKILCLLNRETIFLNNLEEVRNKIRNLFSGLLSDDRFPINDVSLWEQTFMPTSMFKALLVNYILTNEDFSQIPDINKIKWRILGIQYDKFGLAEKGLKLASIQWHREIAEKIDEELKKLLEVEYPIGNEIYRDETGIYFIVGEDLGADKNTNITKLKNELRELESKIYEIFEKATEDEFYPAIFLTKASRGLMNLSYLIENAKNNFLKANRKKDLNLRLINTKKGKAIGICPICQVRLIYESDKEKNNSPTICETCDDRIHHKQVSQWIDNISGETIWLEEVKDKNNRVAYISLKFELEDWLNGNWLNCLLVRNESFRDYFKIIKNLIYSLKNTTWDINIVFFSKNQKEIRRFFELFDKNGIQIPYEILIKDKNIRKVLTQPENNLNDREKSLKDLFFRSLDYSLRFFDKTLNEFINLINGIQNSNFDFNERRFRNQNIFNNNQFKEIIKSLFTIGFFLMQTYNILLERSIGQKWEEFIKSNLSNPNAVDFEARNIRWNLLNDSDIEFLATLLLQFLLRKNPSPARLRRIWETTREFFETVHNDLNKKNFLGIPEWRKNRIYFEIEDENVAKKIKSTGEELEGDSLLYWVFPEGNKIKFYLISSIEDFILKYGNKTKETLLKIRQKTDKEELDKLNNNLSEEIISIEKEITENKNNEEITFKKYGDKEELFSISKNDIKEFKLIPYKPFAKITDPSPKNYQVVIPAEYLERFLDKVMERYNKEFKYVYGKLPLHIGIVVSHYKRPAYVNLKALRRIRRDIKDINKLYKLKKVKEFCVYQKKKLSLATPEELVNNTESYYSLYWDNPDCRDYNFYIKPNNKWKKWISTIDKFPQNANVEMTPNTFDFEFMDTNTRRNDIFYDEENGYKRAIPDKSNRPYEIEEYWDKFKEFRKIFKDKSTSSKLHNLVHILYDKLKDFDKRYVPLLASSFIKILELNKKENEGIKKGIAFIFDIDISQDFYEELKNKLKEKENIKLFLDMFEFWHIMLKEV